MLKSWMGHVFGAWALLCAAPLAAQETGAAGKILPDETLLMIGAEGEAEAYPDTMRIEIGVTSTGTTSDAALTSSSAIMEQVLAVLERYSQDVKSVSSIDFGVNPRFPEDARDEGDVRIIGYESVNELEVTFTDFDRASSLIPALFEAGANSVSGPYWSINDPDTIRQVEGAAIRDAVETARFRATAVAGPLGMRIARILRVSDDRIGRDRYENANTGIVVTGSRMQRIPIVPQPITVNRQIYIEFALVPAG